MKFNEKEIKIKLKEGSYKQEDLKIYEFRILNQKTNKQSVLSVNISNVLKGEH